MLKITNQLIIAEAKKRDWRVQVISEDFGFISYTDTQGREYYARSVLTDQTSVIHKFVSDNKELLSKLASNLGLSVPATEAFVSEEQAHAFLKKHTRIVVKPQDGSHGNGITTGITTKPELKRSIAYAFKVSDRILLQEQVDGEDHRLLYIGGELRAAAVRKPACVIGDGIHTISELITAENRSDDRGLNYQTKLNIIDESAARSFLQENISSIPERGDMVQVVGVANIGTGGYAIDITEQVPPEMKQQADTLVKEFNIKVCGVDFLYDGHNGPKLIEINASPSFGLHAYPTQGKPRPVASDFLDWLQTT